jgi:hypothetical protein
MVFSIVIKAITTPTNDFTLTPILIHSILGYDRPKLNDVIDIALEACRLESSEVLLVEEEQRHFGLLEISL